MDNMLWYCGSSVYPHKNQDVLIEKNFKAYNAIAQHFFCIFKKTFDVQGYEYGLFVEDDLGFAQDFFYYFSGVKLILDHKQETGVWCASGWNDNGYASITPDV